MRPINTISAQRPLPTFFRKRDHLKKAFSTVIAILNNHKLPEDEEGFCKISDILKELHSAPELAYMNEFHICELYFKDKNKRIFINGTDRIKYKKIKYVQPPNTLYFGTLSKLSPKMLKSGIRSSTKRYIKLYDTVEKAEEFGNRFIKCLDDKVVVLKINAEQAFSEGLKFSTYKENEFIVAQINKKYIENEEPKS